jgi:hypothetical protein
MRTAQRAMSIDNINFLSSPNMKPLHQHVDDNIDDQQFETVSNSDYRPRSEETEAATEIQKEDDDDNIIPWKKLLRKTNSRLNLIS